MPRWRGGRVFAMTVLALALLGTGGCVSRPYSQRLPEQLERKVYNKFPLERIGRVARTAANRYSGSRPKLCPASLRQSPLLPARALLPRPPSDLRQRFRSRLRRLMLSPVFSKLSTQSKPIHVRQVVTLSGNLLLTI
jgi:hypothetical protein